MSCVSILTGPATEDVAEIHDRQPVVLADEDVAVWLDLDVSPEDAVRLAGHRPGLFVRHAVSSDVGRNTATGRQLIEPVKLHKQ